MPHTHRTLRDGLFGVAIPRHFVPGYDRYVPPGHLARNDVGGFPNMHGDGIHDHRVIQPRHVANFLGERPLGLAAPDHTVPYGTVLSRDVFPGTSCQATIGVVPPGHAAGHFA